MWIVCGDNKREEIKLTDDIYPFEIECGEYQRESVASLQVEVRRR